MNDYPEIDGIEQKNLQNKYHTGQLMQMLGFTRDTLRYYEEIGLQEKTPSQNKSAPPDSRT